jgi:ParD-like antitoxin of type II bacterial toxin-antitoxin system
VAEAVDRVTRVAADLVDSAAAEGARQSRSAKQQLDHWARVGWAVSSQHTASRRRVEAALAGQLATSELTVEEGVVFNAEISAAVEESLARTNYGAALARGRGLPRWLSTRPARSWSTDPTAPRWCLAPNVDRWLGSVGGPLGR